jgi:hypothetical protein
VKLLISGSRNASPEALRYAKRIVLRARELGWEIVVGDAEGIDYEVAKLCREYGVPFHTYGVTQAHRTLDVSADQYTRVEGDYLARDRYVCELADRGMFIWNGVSRGTKYTHDYMVKLGKPADLRVFRYVARFA